MPEMFIAGSSHNFLSIASKNYFVGEQNQNPASIFTSALSKQKDTCNVLQVFSYSKTVLPVFV